MMAAAEAAEGIYTVSATVEYQACGDQACDAPAAINLTIPVTVARS